MSRGTVLRGKNPHADLLTEKNSAGNRNLTDTSFYARQVNDRLVKCDWQLSKDDKLKLNVSKKICLCIRIFDISPSSSNDKTTCVMKEVEIKEKSKECYINLPVSSGVFLLEIGFRKTYGEWNLIGSSSLYLGDRAPTTLYPDDFWFYHSSEIQASSDTIHERIYNISKPGNNGGSELINSKNEQK